MPINNRFMPWLNWSLTTTFVLFQFFLQSATGLMADTWQINFHLSDTEVGYLSAAFFVSYVILQIPAGLAYDHFSARKILYLASASFFMGTMMLGMSQYFWQAMIARLIMGIGSSFGFIGMLYITSSWFSKKQFSFLVGLSEMLAMVGIAFIEVAMAWVISAYGWRYMLMVSSFLMFIVTMLIFFIVRDNPNHPLTLKASTSVISTIKAVLTYPKVWLAGLYGFAMFSIINVVVNLWGVPFFLKQYPTLSLNSIGFMMSMVYIGTAIGALLTGWLIDYCQNQRAIMVSFALMAAILFALVIYLPVKPIWCEILLFLLGIFSASYIQVFAIVKDSVALKLQATALATTNMILMASALLLQPLIGSILEHHYSFPQALTVVELTLISAVVIGFYLD